MVNGHSLRISPVAWFQQVGISNYRFGFTIQPLLVSSTHKEKREGDVPDELELP